MKSFKIFVCLLLTVIFCFSIGACAMMGHAKSGRVEVTPLANGEFDIYSAGGIVSDRGAIIKNWEEAANNTCNGKYEVVKEMHSGQSPAGTMTMEGRIRCKK